MGYTHYWDSKGIPPEHFSEIQQAVKTIVSAAAYALQCEAINQSADQFIDLNGVSHDAYEDFYIDLTEHGHGFCKTAQRPYDAIVVAVLMYLADAHAEHFTWKSDGAGSNHDDGRRLLAMLE